MCRYQHRLDRPMRCLFLFPHSASIGWKDLVIYPRKSGKTPGLPPLRSLAFRSEQAGCPERHPGKRPLHPRSFPAPVPPELLECIVPPFSGSPSAAPPWPWRRWCQCDAAPAPPKWPVPAGLCRCRYRRKFPPPCPEPVESSAGLPGREGRFC